MVQEIAGGATNQLEGAGREDTGINNGAHHGFSQKTGNGGGFHDSRHTGQPIDSYFFKHTPYREIEGIDMDGNSFFWNQQVGAHKSGGLAQVMAFAIHGIRLVGKFTSQGGI